ncbi:9395_t:CDS:2 [Dentiscutata erythropus]|uniref:9395_t:CDS:1 n=1 Tax=Dentiscutata erythropus TaxID=1348616 RepID=A0A9N9C2X0_9GLOM|nr:9395_t:CDS:2 [Dentiscutata erythropus]
MPSNFGISVYWPFLGGEKNDIFFFVNSSLDSLNIITFDTRLGIWTTNLSFTGQSNKYYFNLYPWISNNYTGKAYSLQFSVVDIFDIINFIWSNSTKIPLEHSLYDRSATFGSPQVLMPNNKILYFPESLINDNTTTLMASILVYDTITNSWQITNTSGAIPNHRTDYSAVLTSDGRIIIYGGTSKFIAATPSLAVLNTSSYEWSVPSEINHVGPLTSHASIMVKNYMIVAFGTNATNNQSNNCIYKLDISDPLRYKWSLFSNDTNNFALPKVNSTTFPTSSNSQDNSIPSHLFFGIGVGVGIGIIVILSFAGFLLYKKKFKNVSENYIPTPGSA